MAKRLTDNQKSEISKRFKNGETIETLSKKFGCTKLTIIRNLKKLLGESIYEDLAIKSKSSAKNPISFLSKNEDKFNSDEFSEIFEENPKDFDITTSEQNKSNYFPNNPFLELTPLDLDIDNSPRRELSSVHISEVEFPKVVYMIVDKLIELEIKQLKDYPDWQFLPADDLNRKSIEIFFDLKIAKRFCNKEQKVIKVPNTNVFKITSSFLRSRGISRIVSGDKLIAL